MTESDIWMADYVPSTPDPQMAVLVASLVRYVLTFLSGIGLVHGVYSDSVVQTIAGAIIGVVMVSWGIWQKYQAAKLDHAGSVRSAENAVAATVSAPTQPPAASAVRAL